jgi:hypothetical protein
MHRSGKLVAVAGLLLGLAACGPLGSPPRTTVNVIGDKFSKAIELQGIPAGNSFDNNGVDWYLRSFVDPQSHATAHQIYVEWFFPGHGTTKYFAADDRARDLPAHQLLKESCGRNCGQTDTVAIDIDETTLRSRAANGFQVKLSTNNGAHVILDITPQMIAAQTQAEDRILHPPAGFSTTAAVASANARTPDGKPFLGVAPMDMPFGLGVVIARVDRNTPAEAAGLKEGDTVLSYNGHPIDKAQQLLDQILLTKPGSVVPVEVERGGKSKVTLSVQM